MCQSNEAFGHLSTTRILRSICICYSTMANQLLAPLGLTLSQCEILLHLYQRPPGMIETSELLETVQIAPPSLSHTLKRLKQNGYIDSMKGDDRRKNQICLTPKALEVQEQIADVFRCLDEKFFFQVTDAECAAVKTILHKISQNISV